MKLELQNLKIVSELSHEERKKAAIQFGIEAAKQWPHTAEQATAWVEGEYTNPVTTIVVVKIDGRIIAAGYYLPVESVLKTFSEDKIPESLTDFVYKHANKTVFIGGIFVEEKFQGNGLARIILNELYKKAKEQGSMFCVAITGVPAANNHLKMLPILLETGWNEFENGRVKSRSYDLEEVWVLYNLNE